MYAGRQGRGKPETDHISRLQQAIQEMHGCKSIHERTARVREVSHGKIIWNGEVEIFALNGHPWAEGCYAWSYQGDDGKEHYTVVLKIPPLDSPEKAVRTALRK
jgi:hypothetical protein